VEIFDAVRTGDLTGVQALVEKDPQLVNFPEETLFVSGHGRDLASGGLRKYRDDLQATNAIVKKGFEAGKSTQEMKRNDLLKNFKPDYSLLEWLGPDWWIEQICQGLGPGAAR
jgi:hypothetical protein